MALRRRAHKLLVPSRDNAYRPHLLRRGALLCFLALVLIAEAALVGNLLLRQSGQSFLAAVVQSEIVALTNTERVQHQVGALRESAQLDAAAQAKADDMAERSYFAHVSPDGREPWDFVAAAGYDYQYAGENLAVRFVDSQEVVDAWMRSPTHRANMVKEQYTEVGVATAQGLYKGEPATFVVQYFAKPSPQALAAAGSVLGAQVQSSASFFNSLSRQIGRVLAEPRAATNFLIGAVAALLMLALGFAFFHHIQLQARGMLLPGVLIATVALVMVASNTHISGAIADEQAAAVLYSTP